MEIGIIITGHGKFATGIYESIKLIAGDQDNCHTIDFKQQMQVDELKALMKQRVEEFSGCDRIIVFADLQGGSPFKTALELSYYDERICLIGGVNLPMLLECALTKDGVDDFDGYTDDLVASGRHGLAKLIITDDEMEED